MADDKLSLSEYTKALISSLRRIKEKKVGSEYNVIEISPTASFFGLLYEKVRNAIDYREENLIRRAAIERILKRRLLLNPTGKGEAENLLRELLWARYFSPGSLTIEDAQVVQSLIDRYLALIRKVVVGRSQEEKIVYSEFLLSLLTCEIEEVLAPYEAAQREFFSYFIFQVLKNKVKLEGISDKDEKDLYVFIAVDKGYFKSDLHYLRYHVFRLIYGRISELNEELLERLVFKFPEIVEFIDNSIKSPYVDKIARFVKREKAAFLILEEIIKRHKSDLEEILSSRSKLEEVVDRICREKYKISKEKVRSAAVRGFVYVFITKMLLALILEYPLSLYVYGEVDYFAISINSIFPPLLMFAIALFTRTPGSDNTNRIYERIVDLVNEDEEFENQVVLITKKPRKKNPVLLFAFTVFYSLTFVGTFSLIFFILELLRFNFISKIIFVFFISVVSFFGYRIRQIAKEYFLVYKQSIYQPVLDFFFIPILSIGKFLSQEIGRWNILVLVFDFIIEAPFKLVVEVIEEWIKFVRVKKEEIT